MKLDLQTIKVKDRLLVVKTGDDEQLDKNVVQQLSKQVRDNGGLGVISLSGEYDVSSLGLNDLKKIVAHMEAAMKKDGKQ